MATSRSLILSGFKEDCEQLITRFERANDIRFQTFCEIWKEMKFSLVFTGRPTFIELLEFCEEALNMCKQFLLLPPRFKERVGGLYLLYGVYYKMPIEQFKIRVKLDDWRSILDLHAEIKEAEHLDTNYILCKLIADGAFHFTIFDKEFGLEKHYRTKEAQCFNPYSVLPSLKDLTDKDQLLSKISELSKIYEKNKQTLLSENKSEASLNLFDPNIAEEIINDIQNFEEQRRLQYMKIGFGHDKASNASTSKVELKPSQLKGTRRKIRPLIDDAFETDTNDSEDEIEIDDSDSDLAENFDIPQTCYSRGRRGPRFRPVIRTDIFFHSDAAVPRPLQNRSTIVRCYSALTINAIQINIAVPEALMTHPESKNWRTCEWHSFYISFGVAGINRINVRHLST